MFRFNDLVMALFSFFLLALNQYLPLPNLITLLLNCLLIVVTIVYIMQFFNVMKPILPSPNLFK